MINNQGVILLADGTRETMQNGTRTIFMRMLDIEQNKVSVQTTRFIERDEDIVSLETLACYETLYNENKTFFENILK